MVTERAPQTFRPDPRLVWRWLEDVPDPEVPVVSVVDLGIVRDVAWEGDALTVTVTPTYSGCPATAVIALEIENAIRDRGIDTVRTKTQVTPAWTTDWMTDAAREKLRAYGIAPPEAGASCAGMLRSGAPSSCPHCGSSRVEEVSRFGSTPCKATWRCADCLEPFDYFKSF
ncbi:MAG: 1,2-phenylacetyl-CoA epoxidase subunit PaaD [Pseudomonadota bacterium]